MIDKTEDVEKGCVGKSVRMNCQWKAQYRKKEDVKRGVVSKRTGLDWKGNSTSTTYFYLSSRTHLFGTNSGLFSGAMLTDSQSTSTRGGTSGNSD